jgi:hypothetical protein
MVMEGGIEENIGVGESRCSSDVVELFFFDSLELLCNLVFSLSSYQRQTSLCGRSPGLADGTTALTLCEC